MKTSQFEHLGDGVTIITIDEVVDFPESLPRLQDWAIAVEKATSEVVVEMPNDGEVVVKIKLTVPVPPAKKEAEPLKADSTPEEKEKADAKAKEEKAKADAARQKEVDRLKSPEHIAENKKKLEPKEEVAEESEKKASHPAGPTSHKGK